MNLAKRTGLLGVVAGFVLVLGGCASMDQTPTDYFADAIALAQQGYDELDLMDDDAWKGSADGALFHFNEAIDYFKDAVADLSKADLSPADQPGFTALKSGLADLQSAVNSLEKNDIATAQTQFASAQSQFSVAAGILQ